MTTPVVDTSINPKIIVGQTASNVVSVDGRTVFGMYVPKELTGSIIKFKSGITSANLAQMRDDNAADIAVNVAAPSGADNFSYVQLSGIVFAGVQFLQLISGSSQLTADAQFYLSVRPV